MWMGPGCREHKGLSQDRANEIPAAGLIYGFAKLQDLGSGEITWNMVFSLSELSNQGWAEREVRQGFGDTSHCSPNSEGIFPWQIQCQDICQENGCPK